MKKQTSILLMMNLNIRHILRQKETADISINISTTTTRTITANHTKANLDQNGPNVFFVWGLVDANGVAVRDGCGEVMTNIPVQIAKPTRMDYVQIVPVEVW